MRYALLLSVLFSGACADAPPPALKVGTASFSADQLLGLSESRVRTLATLAGFGLAVSDSSQRQLGAPLLAQRENDVLLDVLAAQITLEKHDVGDDVLEARYLTEPDYELTVRHILFFSERWRTADHRAAALAKAQRAAAALREGADFAETAAALSEEPGAEGRQGLLTPGRKGAWVDEFWEAASALEVGEISPVTETQYGYHILRLEGREVVPFAEARSRVAREVADQLEDPRAVLDAFLDALPEVYVAEDVVAASTYDTFRPTTVLASWDGGRLDFADFSAFSVAQPAGWREGGLGWDEDRLRESIRTLARRKQGLAEAERRGLRVPSAEVDRILRSWDDDVYRWSTALGFAYGESGQGVSEAALAALARTGQEADLARKELSQHAPLVRARYEVVTAPGAGD